MKRRILVDMPRDARVVSIKRAGTSYGLDGAPFWKPPPPPYPPPPGTRGPLPAPPPVSTTPQYPSQLNDKSQSSPFASSESEKNTHGESAFEARLAQTIVSNPQVPASDIQGQDRLIKTLTAIVREPIENPSSGLGWTGILLYGPPGTGKTLIAKMIASMAHPAKFMSVSSADLGSSWQGESERMIKALFTVARKNRPVVVFIDELDSLLGKRNSSSRDATGNKVKTQFLIEMEGLGRDKSQILVVGATNNPWDLDDAVLSRLRKRYYVGLPDDATRAAMLTRFLNETKVASPALFQQPFFSETIKATRGMSGREIKALIEEALVQAVVRKRESKQNVLQILPVDMVQAAVSTGRSVTAETITRYGKWAEARQLSTADITRDLELFK